MANENYSSAAQRYRAISSNDVVESGVKPILRYQIGIRS